MKKSWTDEVGVVAGEEEVLEEPMMTLLFRLAIAAEAAVAVVVVVVVAEKVEPRG